MSWMQRNFPERFRRTSLTDFGEPTRVVLTMRNDSMVRISSSFLSRFSLKNLLSTSQCYFRPPKKVYQYRSFSADPSHFNLSDLQIAPASHCLLLPVSYWWFNRPMSVTIQPITIQSVTVQLWFGFQRWQTAAIYPLCHKHNSRLTTTTSPSVSLSSTRDPASSTPLEHA